MEKWQKKDRKKERKRKEQESAEAISNQLIRGKIHKYNKKT